MSTAHILLLNLLVHVSALLALTWFADRRHVLRTRRSRELAWSIALVGGFLTLGLQLALPAEPLAGRWQAFEAERISATGNPAFATPLETPDVQPERDRIENDPITQTSKSGNRVSLNLPDIDTRLLLNAWLLVSTLLLVTLGFNAWRLQRRLRTRHMQVSGRLADTLFQLAADAGVECPRLSFMDDLPGPVTLPGGEICVPGWTEQRLDSAQCKAMLAHELAHVLRRDPARQFATTVISALFFFHPLVHVARKRLELLAELACDDWATQQTGDGRALAECLGVCAASLADEHPGLPMQFGTAMAKHHSALIQRVQRLLRGDYEIDGDLSMKNIMFIACTLLGLGIGLPALATQTVGDEDTHRISVHQSDNNISLSIHQDDMQLRVKGEGSFEFNAEENDIVEISDGGALTIYADVDDVEHEFEFLENDGRIEHRYTRDGDRQPWDATARAALGNVLPMVLRETGIDAEARVARLLDAGGVDRVLEDIELIRGDFATRRYITLLLDQADDFSDAQVSRLIASTDSIGSDFELRHVLAAIASQLELDKSQAIALFRAARSIGSDFELRSLIETMLPLVKQHPDSRAALFETAGSIGSDFELRQALTGLMQGANDAELIMAMYQLAGDSIGSDFELRSLLESTVSLIGDADELAQAYAAASKSIGSDFEQRMAITAFTKSVSVGEAGWLAILDAADTIGSDSEAAEALIAIANEMSRSDRLNARFRAVLDKVGSDFEHRRVERHISRP